MTNRDTAEMLAEFFHEYGYETLVQWSRTEQISWLDFDHTQQFITIWGTRIYFGRGQFSVEQEFDLILNHLIVF